MEKNKIKHTAFLAVLLTLTSCAQEGPGEAASSGDGQRIFFRSYLPAVSLTRAGVISNSNLTECRVTCLNPEDSELIDPATGEMTPYFENINFIKEDDKFVAEDDDKGFWPSLRNQLHFFAFSPSTEEMWNAAGEGTFDLVNNSLIKGGFPIIKYKLEDFQVASDIADQIDFIAAYSSGSQQTDENSGVELAFNHQLARIELSAWSNSILYDVEIAGLRIGNAITKGEFNFSALILGSDDDLWRNRSQSSVEYIFKAGDSIVKLGKNTGSHIEKGDATSIMGNAASAMVIPMTEMIEAWEGKADPNIDDTDYTTDRLYFSVLMRVVSPKAGVVYPYPNGSYKLPTEYLTVDPDGIVTGRVYRYNGIFYTEDEEEESYRYIPNGNEEIQGFCWATVPVAAKWEAGKIYSYKLNYSNGVGWHDPSYPDPGKPIITGKVGVSVEVADWKEGSKTETTVPRK